MTNEDKKVKEWLKQCEELIRERLSKTNPKLFIDHDFRLSVNEEKFSKESP